MSGGAGGTWFAWVLDLVAGEPALWLALWIGVLLVALTAVFLVQIVVLRALRRVRERRRRAFVVRWRPLLAASLAAPPATLPRLARADRLAFLLLWNHIHETLRGEGEAPLNEVARRLGLDRILLRLLRNHDLGWRLLAIRSLGHLGEAKAAPALEQFVRGGHPVASLAAARALLQIDPGRLPGLAPLFAARRDWPAGRVAAVLGQLADRPATCVALIQSLEATPSGDQPRLIRFLGALRCPRAAVALRRLLDAGAAPAVIVACLPSLREPQDLPRVRLLLQYPDPQVRQHAATALGRLALPGDEARLAALLADDDWWVRYRAARALVDLPFLTTQALAALQDAQAQPQAHEMLERALAEEGRG